MEGANTDTERPPPLLSQEGSTLPSRRGSKRLSLQFQLPPADQARTRPRPASITTASPSSMRPLSPETGVSSDPDPNSFLTALAAQERKVLELKEELQKAEADLSKLKTQWAVHEATKKRSEIHKLEQLREFPSPYKATFEPRALRRSRTSLEDERKRSMQTKTKQTQMKVFSGGRHTRALSLLSPNSLPSPAESYSAPVSATSTTSTTSQTKHSGPQPSATSTHPNHTHSQTHNANRDLVHTGKDLVGGIRDGLWTFIEDLKQATVGDEAVTGARVKYAAGTGARSPALPRRRSPAPGSPDVAGKTKVNSVGEENARAITTRGENPKKHPTLVSKDPMVDEDDFDDGWDNWDSPPPKTGSGSTFSTTAGSSPRTSLSSTTSKEKQAIESEATTYNVDPLPWPALTKLRPGSLTRTASQLMMEWERSLTPPPEERGITHPASRASVEKERKAD